MQHFSTLESYCKGINIASPKWSDFDTRDFQDNMKTVHQQMPPFKHEFYAVALKLDGGGYTKTGNFSTENLRATVFFNSPYQIVQWDIAPDWEGYYIIFTEEFYKRDNSKRNIGEDFPFLLVDNTVPLSIDEDEAATFINTFQEIHKEHQLARKDTSPIIFHCTQIILHKVSRLYDSKVPQESRSFVHRDNDIALVSRFKTLIETSFYPDQSFEGSEPHKVQFYADKLAIHPNHLNAVVKRITNSSASEIIYKHMLALAKSRLKNTQKSIKEIAFDLYYNYPNHFANFFKKHTGITPVQYRKG
ncbi:MAG: helix-turn-helix domain-containing protein [Bacteroidota bacterium]